MNQGKIGEPFHYPNTSLLLLGYAKVYFHLPYRQTKEGITQGHVKGNIQKLIICAYIINGFDGNRLEIYTDLDDYAVAVLSKITRII